MSDFAPKKAYTSNSIDEEDGTGNSNGNMNRNVVSNPIYCLTSILPYLEGQNKRSLKKLIVEATSTTSGIGIRQTLPSKVNVKYRNFQFKSHIFEQSPLSVAYHKGMESDGI